MALLLRKFSLGLKNYLSLGLRGKQVEIRITSYGKRTLTLSLMELHILRNSASSLEESAVTLSSSENHFGEPVTRRCEPGSNHVRFVRETFTPAQPLEPEDNVNVEYTLEHVSLRAFLRFLPNIITIAELIMSEEAAISLAYTVVGSQIRRLCDANGYHSTYDHFLYIMRLLHQYVPISFLVSDFKKNCDQEPALNLYELFKTILFQFEYIYESLYSQ